MPVAYLNGRFLAQEQACVPVTDRAFLFGDGVYEVIPAYQGHPLRLSQHLTRLQRSLDGLRLANPMDDAGWRRVVGELIERNGGGDVSVYLQVSRGAPPARDHGFPKPGVAATVTGFCQPLKPWPKDVLERGAAAVVRDDDRWAHCDIKSTALLANVLLKQQAIDAGAAEAILVRDGHVTEGASSNVFVVVGDVALTPPQSGYVLPGITRDLILELAAADGLPVRFGDVTRSRLYAADEIWITSSTREALPITMLDGQAVGGGKPGPLWRRVHERLQRYKQAACLQPS